MFYTIEPYFRNNNGLIIFFNRLRLKVNTINNLLGDTSVTDITGNFGVNASKYTQDVTRTEKPCAHKGCPSCDEDAPKERMDLNRDPASVSGRSLVKTQSAGKKGEYVFDPKRVEDDLKEFQALWLVKQSADEYKQNLIDNGYEETAAQEKAAVFAACLLSVQNV